MIYTPKHNNTHKLLMRLYNSLLDRYGHQEWWPADSPWEVCVGAILTQNTNWNNVEKAILNLKNADLIGKGGKSSNPNAFLDIEPSIIAELIRPSGYFNLKTKRLLALAEWWKDNTLNDKFIKPGIELNYLRKELLKVYGVGEETADTIILYAFNLPSFIIDTYTKRISSVYLNSSMNVRYEELQSIYMDNLPHDPSLFNEFHALIVRLAKEKEWKEIINLLPIC